MGEYAGTEEHTKSPAYVYMKPAHGCSQQLYSRMPKLRAKVPSVDTWLSKLHFPDGLPARLSGLTNMSHSCR